MTKKSALDEMFSALDRVTKESGAIDILKDKGSSALKQVAQHGKEAFQSFKENQSPSSKSFSQPVKTDLKTNELKEALANLDKNSPDFSDNIDKLYDKYPLEFQELLRENEKKDNAPSSTASSSEKVVSQEAKKDEFKVIPPEFTLEEMVGQDEAKYAITKILSIQKANARRVKKGKKDKDFTLHAIIKGPPGTGKTNFARLYAQEIKKLGLLSKGHVIEASRNDFISPHQGGTAKKTLELLNKGLGGIILVDEAYALDDKEAIDAMIAFMENHRDDFIMLFAGYDALMEKWSHVNPGLKSRIGDNVIKFNDYDNATLLQILDTFAKKEGFIIEDKAKNLVANELTVKRQVSSFGNAREVRNIFERAIIKQMVRLSSVTDEELAALPEDTDSTLIYSDFTEELSDKGTFEEIGKMVQNRMMEGTRALDELIGLKTVKNDLQALAVRLKWDTKRSAENTKNFNLVMAFSGSSGTGKTEVAKRMGKVLKSMGVLALGHTIVVSRPDLVASYSGQTAPKVEAAIKHALGGVLVIKDPASLVQNAQDQFGVEAVDTLRTQLKSYRGKLLVIFQGSPEKNKAFLAQAGIEISNTFTFEPYKDEELKLLTKKFLKEMGLKADIKVMSRIDKIMEKNSDGSGNKIQNILMQFSSNLARRLQNAEDKGFEITSEMLETLTLDDVPDTGFSFFK